MEDQARRARVRDIQTRLNDLNFNAGPVDGVSGRKTRNAVSAFQQSIGNQPTGQLTAQELEVLHSLTNNQTAELPLDGNINTFGTDGLQPETEGVNPFADDGLAGGSTLPTPPVVQGTAAHASATMTLEPLPDIDVFGIRPLDTGGTVEQTLVARGMADCVSQNTLLVCNNENNTMYDKVMVGLSDSGNGTVVHTVQRSLRFKRSQPRDTVIKLFFQYYPELAATERNMMASSDECLSTATGIGGEAVTDLQTWIESSRPVDDRIAELAVKCDYFFVLSLPQDERIEQVAITLFSGRPIVATLTEGQLESASSLSIDF